MVSSMSISIARGRFVMVSKPFDSKPFVYKPFWPDAWTGSCGRVPAHIKSTAPGPIPADDVAGEPLWPGDGGRFFLFFFFWLVLVLFFVLLPLFFIVFVFVLVFVV